jgi:hypothetical protein
LKKTTFITKHSSLLWYLKNQRHLCSHHFNCFNSTVQLIYLGREPIFYVPRPKYIIHIHASNINHYDVIDRALCILSHKVIKDVLSNNLLQLLLLDNGGRTFMSPWITLVFSENVNMK